MNDERCSEIESLLHTVRQALAVADTLKLALVGIRLHQATVALTEEWERMCSEKALLAGS